jgi:hypothetical protein
MSDKPTDDNAKDHPIATAIVRGDNPRDIRAMIMSAPADKLFADLAAASSIKEIVGKIGIAKGRDDTAWKACLTAICMAASKSLGAVKEKSAHPIIKQAFADVSKDILVKAGVANLTCKRCVR